MLLVTHQTGNPLNEERSAQQMNLRRIVLLMISLFALSIVTFWWNWDPPLTAQERLQVVKIWNPPPTTLGAAEIPPIHLEPQQITVETLYSLIALMIAAL